MYLALVVVISVVLLILAVQNPDTTFLRFLTWQWQVPTVVLVIGSALAGALISSALGVAGRFRLGRRLREQGARIRALEEQLGSQTAPAEEVQKQ